MSTVPAWIQILQALLTPVIAIGVGIIAFMQWRTAHQKVVLDLFDRRLAVVNEVNGAVNYAISENGNLVATNAAMRLYECEEKALFLFGSEVLNNIEKIRLDVLNFHRLRHELGDGHLLADEANDLNKRVGAAFLSIGTGQTKFVATVTPYMKMHSKVVATPTEWFEARNRARLSYADEKQK